MSLTAIANVNVTVLLCLSAASAAEPGGLLNCAAETMHLAGAGGLPGGAATFPIISPSSSFDLFFSRFSIYQPVQLRPRSWRDLVGYLAALDRSAMEMMTSGATRREVEQLFGLNAVVDVRLPCS